MTAANHQSIVQARGHVTFPAFLVERIYMREFRLDIGLPADLQRWQPTVDAMLDGVDTDGPIYLMIDQGIVKAGTTQRRPGLHVDGYWIAADRAHGGHRLSAHGGIPGHNSRPAPTPHHRGISLSGAWDDGGGRWNDCDFSTPEATILASNITASRALVGQFQGSPREGGDCSHLDISGLTEVALQADRVYAGNVTMLHESLPVHVTCMRTLVRLTVPGWEPKP